MRVVVDVSVAVNVEIDVSVTTVLVESGVSKIGVTVSPDAF